MNNNFAIVVIGYNRVSAIKRLLNSLTKAKYYNEEIPLVISIDKSETNEVYKVAENFEWKFGEKKIITYEKRLGLRNHILKCGDLTEKYENIIVLEDDLYVSPFFYKFAKEATQFLKLKNRVAGISLYTHKWNVNCNRPFEIGDDSSDIYYQQFAQSWGQVWNREEWKKFKKWYLENKEKDFSKENIPEIVLKWPETSWLKFHIIYLIKTKQYFIYPKLSLTTNFIEVGQHAKSKSNDFQVPIQIVDKEKYNFIELEKSKLCYDAFFESENLSDYLKIDKENLCVDLYGNKKNISKKRFWLTSKKLNYKIIKKYGLNMRPHENNILLDIEGDEIYLYDTNIILRNNASDMRDIQIKYDLKGISRKDIFKVCIKYFIKRLKNYKK